MAVPLFLGLVLAIQANGAILAGTVRNESTGETIPGALVTLADLNRAVTTDASGRYTLTDVPAGPQHLSIRAIGYQSRTLHALVPGAGRLTIDVSLRAAPVHLPSLEVRGNLAVRGL